MRFVRYSLAFLIVLAFSATGAMAETYYISPDVDNNDGAGTREDPFGTFDVIPGPVTPGDTLILLDGVYTVENSGALDIQLAGQESQPTTVIMADNERQAWIQSDGLAPAININAYNLVIKGIRASNVDNAENDGNSDGTPMTIAGGSINVEVRRMLLHDPNRYGNNAALKTGGSNILIVETEAYNFFNTGFEAFNADSVVVRRCYANGRGVSDVAGGYATDNTDGGDGAYRAQATNGWVVENSISEGGNLGFEAAAFHPPFLADDGDLRGENNSFYGNISINDQVAGSMFSLYRPIDGPGGSETNNSMPLRNSEIVDFLAVSPDTGLTVHAAQDLRIANASIMNSGTSALIVDNEAAPESETNQFKICGGSDSDADANADNCSYQVPNYLALSNTDNAILWKGSTGSIDFLAEFSNFFDNNEIGTDDDNIGDAAGAIQNSTQTDPGNIGTDACTVYAANSDVLAGAGADGADVGANLAYRYVNAEKTEEPLWPFPTGAVIDNSPNSPDSGAVASTVGTRLNVSSDCLPYEVVGDAIAGLDEVPSGFGLEQNYPNPFNPTTTIPFKLHKAGHVTLTVYDVLGREVATLVDRTLPAGDDYQVTFEAADLPSGVYLYQLDALGHQLTGKMMLVK